MSDPFIAEIRIVPFNFAPIGWALCDGQVIPLSQNTALFSLLGTTYGGDGRSNFALPNLQGCAAVQQGQGPGLSLYELGESGGSETVTLLETEMPAHNHSVVATTDAADSANPTNSLLAEANYAGDSILEYKSAGGSTVLMDETAIDPAGGSLPHNNMQPYLVLNFIIALQGVYPPRS
jgi:microcystin-dependent protein